MFSQRCPKCGNKIHLKDRLVLLYKFHGTCKYCGLEYIPNETPMIVSGAVMGAIFGVSLMAVSGWDILTVTIASVLICLVFQRFINIFYTITPVDK